MSSEADAHVDEMRAERCSCDTKGDLIFEMVIFRGLVGERADLFLPRERI